MTIQPAIDINRPILEAISNLEQCEVMQIIVALDSLAQLGQEDENPERQRYWKHRHDALRCLADAAGRFDDIEDYYQNCEVPDRRDLEAQS